MPARRGTRPLKAWRWVGCFGPELTLCLAQVRVGPARRGFYAIWDRVEGRLLERHRADVEFAVGLARVRERDVVLELSFSETAGIETVSAMGDAYAWTRKQGGLPAHGRLMLGGRPRDFSGAVIIDDSAGYHPRRTAWRWCAGVGTSDDGRSLAWNLVEGLHDAPVNSERTLWCDGEPRELAPVPIAPDLTRVGELRFSAERTRTRTENLLLVRSRLTQPVGTFSGRIDGIPLAAGFGVMESHRAVW